MGLALPDPCLKPKQTPSSISSLLPAAWLALDWSQAFHSPSRSKEDLTFQTRLVPSTETHPETTALKSHSAFWCTPIPLLAPPALWALAQWRGFAETHWRSCAAPDDLSKARDGAAVLKKSSWTVLWKRTTHQGQLPHGLQQRRLVSK